MSDSGVTGFPPGKQVTLIKETKAGFEITDGIVRAIAPKNSLTNDLNVLNAVLNQGGSQTSSFSLSATQPASAATPVNAQVPKTRKDGDKVASIPAKSADDKKLAASARQKKQLQADLADLDKRIKAAQAEIEEKKGSQRPVRRIYDAWGRLISYQGRSMYTLSPDASGLGPLIAKRDKLAERLAELE